MATTSADVPGLYDLVVAVSGGNTTGFLLNDSLESSIPFRTHRAIYTYTPTFIERQNVSGDFGDNQQDFFLRATQRDWSLGEQQRYFHQSDADSVRRYWQGSAIDISVPGQASIGRAITTIALAVTPVAMGGNIVISGSAEHVGVATSTKLFTVQPSAGTSVDRGVHGLGAAPSQWGVTGDLANLYLTTTAAGTVGVRRWNGTAYSTFSATGADSLCYLNNALYGFSGATGSLIRYDTSGTATTLFTWKDALGFTLPAGTKSKVVPFGGKLAILRYAFGSNIPGELWLYDGAGVSLIAALPDGFIPYDILAANGSVFVSGTSNVDAKAMIYAWAGGTLSVLCKSVDSITKPPALAPAPGGIYFQWALSGQQCLMLYNSETGGISSLSDTAFDLGTTPALASVGSGNAAGVSLAGNGDVKILSSSLANQGIVNTSLFDFDSSLAKLFRGVTVEFDSATDGDGGSVDLYYATESTSGSVTSLRVAAASGTEYTLSGVSGRRIRAQAALNKGTSTLGPVLKRVSVRAAPVLTRYRQQEYILACVGDPSTEDGMALRDDGNSTHPLAGRQQVNELRLAAASQTPLTLTDRFGSYTGIIETMEAYEMHPSNADPSRSGSFLVKLGTREV